MAKRGVIEVKAATLSTVKKMLSERKKEGELTFEQKVALDYAKEFGKGKEKEVDKLVSALTEMGIDESVAVKIINVVPETKEEVRVIFEKSRFDLKDDHINKILELMKELSE